MGLGKELKGIGNVLAEVMMPSHPFLKVVQICGQAQFAEITEGVANELECTRLQLLADERVYRIHRLRDREGRIFLVEDVTLPAALFPGLADKEFVAGSHRTPRSGVRDPLGRAEERISMGYRRMLSRMLFVSLRRTDYSARSRRPHARLASARSNGDWRTVTRRVPTFVSWS